MKILSDDSKRLVPGIPLHESVLPQKLPKGKLLSIDQKC